VCASKFDELVKDGRMPKSFHIDGCVLWDRYDLDDAFEAFKSVRVNPLDAKYLS
jgi:hypothetical protein